MLHFEPTDGFVSKIYLVDYETEKEYLIYDKQTTMKDNLLPFDLEEAKKDPTRVRAKDGSKPKEIHIFNTGIVAIIWEGRCGPTTYINDIDYLRLTPKRMFVNIITNSDITGTPELGCIWFSLEDAIRRRSHPYKTFELIPVKEDGKV